MNFHQLFTVLLLFIFAFVFNDLNGDEIFLRDNLMRANAGDFLVAAQGKNYVLMLIREKNEKNLIIEEICVPLDRFPKNTPSWRAWVADQAPGNTSWVAYEIQPWTGQVLKFFSYTKNSWCILDDSNQFLGKLLNLRLQRMNPARRKRVGPMPREGEIDRRPFWNPPLIIDGQTIKGVEFDAWRTRWPSDGTELSGKLIDVYLPRDENRYPGYFPYWLQIGGAIGKAKIRIVDSGSDLSSPMPPMPRHQISQTQ